MAVLLKLLLAAWVLLWLASQALALVERCGGPIGRSAGETLVRWRRTGSIVGRVILIAFALAVAHMIVTRFLTGSD
ncbi:MAG: hypothetical protein IT577_17095 [Verrucomicrobiae bacterium]|nr:hypothetical protein [Verrucomicrobiae bacterium]